MCKVQELVMPVFPRLSRRRACLTRDELASTGPQWTEIVSRIAEAQVIGPVSIGVFLRKSFRAERGKEFHNGCATCEKATLDRVLADLMSWDTFVRPDPGDYTDLEPEFFVFSNAGATLVAIDEYFRNIPFGWCDEHSGTKRKSLPKGTFVGRIGVEFQDVSLRIGFYQE